MSIPVKQAQNLCMDAVVYASTRFDEHILKNVFQNFKSKMFENIQAHKQPWEIFRFL